ncbi:MAG: hypothetical protein K2L70_04850 [Clostridia bacterium]|nr:hypothetical protein [Clostridia bacterium]
MREGLELVLDKIESRIGKRDNFLVDDVINYFLQEDGVIEMSMDELEHYARNGERIEDVVSFEIAPEYQPGSKFRGKMIYDKSLLLGKDFLLRKYGEQHKNFCIKCKKEDSLIPWVDAQGIVVATLDYQHILCIESSISWEYEELYIVNAFLCKRRLDEVEFANESQRQEEKERLMEYWDSWFERKARTYVI